jgi:glutathione peroxidase
MNFFDLSAEDSELKPYPLNQHQGKVVLVVNVASRCGFTPQYKALEQIYEKYKDQGLVILGFPCNQFGHQEPGSNQQIQEFCQLNYKVSFPVLNKVEVNGENTHSVYKFLKSNAPGILGTEAIKWNFTKFLINREGQVVGRYAPQTDPKDIVPDIEKLL